MEEDGQRFIDMMTSAGLKVQQRPVQVRHLDLFLKTIDDLTPELKQARDEISPSAEVGPTEHNPSPELEIRMNNACCTFFPGMGEAFKPGTKVVTYPENMQGAALGMNVVQSW
jgi:hypothetical protein